MTQVHETDAQEAHGWQQDGSAVLVDVREDNELMQARIPGAVHVPLSRFDPDDVPNDDGKRVVFICAQGMRSLQAAEYMVAQEFLTEAYNLTDGIMGWARDGMPLETG